MCNIETMRRDARRTTLCPLFRVRVPRFGTTAPLLLSRALQPPDKAAPTARHAQSEPSAVHKSQTKDNNISKPTSGYIVRGFPSFNIPQQFCSRWPCTCVVQSQTEERGVKNTNVTYTVNINKVAES